MFGFSIPKIILLFIIIFIIWNVFRYIEKKNLSSKRRESDKNKEENGIEESLVECKVCGNFFSSYLPEGCPTCNREK